MPARHRLGACLVVLRNSSLRRLAIAFLSFVTIETTTWIGSLLYAFKRGGTREVGLAAALLLVPGIVAAPLASFCGDRFHRVKVLASAYACTTAASFATALAIATHAHPLLVYAATAAVATADTFPRPAMGALLPCVATSTNHLTAANVTVGLAQSLGVAVGPAIAAVLLAVAGLAWVFVGTGIAGAVSTVLTVSVRGIANAKPSREQITVVDVHHETVAGLQLLLHQRAPRLVVGVLGLTAMLVGALDVANVVVAIDVLRRADSFAGVLGAAIGIGGITGASASALLIGRRRLAPALVGAVLLQSVPLLGFALHTSVAVAVAVFAVCGAGRSLAELAGQTTLQGVTPDDTMARVFGCLEGVRMAGYSAGSLLCATVLERFGARSGLPVLVAVVVGLLAIAVPGLLAIDRIRPEPNHELLGLLRATTVFSPLPAYTLEQLTASLQRIDPAAGSAVVSEGEPGMTMYLVGAGHAEVHRDGQVVHVCTTGDYFGEMALMFDQPRNATVVAGCDTVLYELQRDTFLEALTGHPRSLQRAHEMAQRRTAQ